MKPNLLLLSLSAASIGLSAGAQPLAPSLSLVGEDGKAQRVSPKDLDALPLSDAEISHDGKIMTFKGPALADVVKRVGAPLGAQMRGPALSDVVIVTAGDGYVVTLALSDLEPSIRPGKIILADAAGDGSALGPDGPFRLVVEGDLKPARSARNVVSIEVRRLRIAH